MVVANFESYLSIGHDNATSAGRFSAPFVMTAICAFFPTLIFFVFSTSSGAVGLLAGAGTIVILMGFGFGMMPSRREILDAMVLIVLLLLIIGTHSAIAAYIYSPELLRTVLSAVSLSIVIFVALLMRHTLFDGNQVDIARATNTMRALFLIISLFGILELQPDPTRSLKPVFPFTEPSHFALMFAPFLIDGCVRARYWPRIVLIATGFVVAFLLKSLSLMVVMLMVLMLCLPLLPMIALSAVMAVIASSLDLSYFTDRLDLSVHSQNLSTLVYLQGYELISDSIHRTNGWGIGFQQLGYAPVNSPTADQIVRLFGTDVNLQDGGFTASKLLSEFGFVGLILLVAYLVYASLCLRRLRSYAIGRDRTSTPGTILAMAFVVAFIIELFVRGIGYFSGTAMFLVAALAHLLETPGTMRTKVAKAA